MDPTGGIMLSEVSQDQKQKSCHVFSHTWKTDLKMNIYTKTSMIIYKLRCSMFVIVEVLYRTREKRERKKER
jgi:hypothetical protein